MRFSRVVSRVLLRVSLFCCVFAIAIVLAQPTITTAQTPPETSQLFGCPSGSYLNSGCRLCPPGTYQPVSNNIFGESSCIEASRGYHVPQAGSANETACPAGRYSDFEGATFCFSASPGYYVSAPASTYQMDCTPGTFASGFGSVSCSLASPGYYATGFASTFQTPCTAGNYNPRERSSYCTPASLGHYVPGSASATQYACAPGSYAPLTGMTNCSPASPGNYIPNPASINQTPCAVGTYYPSSGAISCYAASPGNYVPGTGYTVQFQCQLGRYTPLSGMSACTHASPGHYVPTVGSFVQLSCPAGRYAPFSGQSSCFMAQPGHYVSQIASSGQTACLAGTYNPNYGSISPSSCIPADEGYYVPTAGSPEQLVCPEGTSSIGTGNISCFNLVTTGTLAVTKVVDWNGAEVNEAVFFEICITGASYPAGDCQTVGATGGVLLWEDLEPDAYIVDEIDPIGWAVNEPLGTVEVIADDTAQVTITNTLSRGGVTVNKVVDWNSVTPDTTLLFTICISGPSYPTGNCVFADYDGGFLTWLDLIPGDYTITENNPGADWTVNGSGQVVNVSAGNITQATITNTHAPLLATCDGRDLRLDLTGWIDGGVTGTVRNDGIATCTYQIGLASYEKFDEIIDNQVLFDSTSVSVTLAPGETATLSVAVPACSAQVDLFYGDVLTSLNGQRYGDRLLAAVHINGDNYCQQPTPVDVPAETTQEAP